MMSSVGIDYDGDGNTSEGIYDELVGLRDKLGAAIRTLRFGARHADLLRRQQLPLLVRRRRRRRQLLDRGGGDRQRVHELDPAPAARHLQLPDGAARIRARSPTTRSTSSSCSTTRSPTSTRALVAKVDMSKATRTDVGHFNGASEAARHWDQGEQVDATCSSCHGGEEGFRFYVQYRLGQVVPETANGLECGTCHDKPGTDFSAIIAVPSVTFPSGVTRQEPGLRQRVRDLPPRPRVQGQRRRGDRGGQAGVQERALPARRRRSSSARRSTSATSTTARPTSAR